jgi:ABC-type dipeptide/oligopeptide/nickel transport system ATPase component
MREEPNLPAILRLIKKPGKIVGGQILYQGNDIVTMPETELRNIRGRRSASSSRNR